MNKLFLSLCSAVFFFSSLVVYGKVQADSDYCPAPGTFKDSFTLTKELGEGFVDNTRDLKDFNTAFVNAAFFKTPETFFTFMEQVNEKINAAINNFKKEKNLDDSAILFLFKGGNVLRMLAKSFLSQLPFSLKTELSERYLPYFKRSDADFGIIVNYQKIGDLNYEDLMRELSMVVYQALTSLTKEFTKNADEYFNFEQLKPEIASKIMKKYFDEVNELEAINDSDNPLWHNAEILQVQVKNGSTDPSNKCTYEGQYDFLIDYLNQKNQKVLLAKKLNDKRNWINTTINYTLEWPTSVSEDDIIKFYLVRSKIQFDYLLRKDNKNLRRSIGGELIDISMVHKDDSFLPELLEHIDDMVTTYTLTLKETGESFTFLSESFLGLAKDLYETVFESNLRPWLDKKYEKRVNRLFLIGIAEMATSLGIGKDMQAYVSQMKQALNPILDFSSLSNNQVAQSEKLVDKLGEDWAKLEILNSIPRALVQVASDMLENPMENDEENYDAFIKLLKDNFGVLEYVNQLEEEHLVVPLQNIYDIDMETFFHNY